MGTFLRLHQVKGILSWINTDKVEDAGMNDTLVLCVIIQKLYKYLFGRVVPINFFKNPLVVAGTCDFRPLSECLIHRHHFAFVRQHLDIMGF